MNTMANGLPARLDVGPFLGRAYVEGGCYAFAREVLASVGVELPENQAEALAGRASIVRELHSGEGCKAGDLILMKGEGAYEYHVGVAIDPFKVISLERGGVTTRKLSAIVEAGILRQRLRVRATEELVGVTLHVHSDPLTLTRTRSVHAMVPRGAGSLARLAREYATGGWVAAVNGTPVPEAEVDGFQVRDGDVVLLAPKVGDGGSLALVAIGIGAALVSSFISPRSRLPATLGTSDAESKRYGFGKFSSDAIEGDVEPVWMGARRYGGKVVSAIQGEGADGSGDSRLKMLLDLSHGEMNKIGNQTADFDDVDAADMAGIYLNDQPIASFPGCRLSGRMGTVGQATVRAFKDNEVPREVGVGGVVLRNTSGSERTGGSASGEAYTFDTIDDVDQVVLRIRLASGLFSTSETGQLNPRTVKYRYRTRLHAGPGSWSAWEVVTVTQARQSEFYSSPRSALLNGGAEARHDVQVERVSVEPAGLTDVDALTWDQVVNVTEGENTFDGYAVLALDLVASEQLQGIPRVSVDGEGIKVRVWDGVSDPDSPTFATAYSNNPMALALELITNTIWGAGSLYGDENVDFASLLECWAKCDAEIARTGPAGGTRKRFTYNKVLDSAVSFDEQLLEICRAARVTPTLSGGLWRFVMDDVQETPAERFTDGSIVLESTEPESVADFEYTREAREGGKVAANRLVGQIELADAGFLPASVAFPELGTEWLGSPLEEPVHEQSVRLDGITDLEQAGSEIKYQTKKIRFQTKEVAFTTSRQAISVQPGDRFDVAMSLPGWGLASGRVESFPPETPEATASAVAIDRTVTLAVGKAYYFNVIHLDGSFESTRITSPAGVYEKGTPLTLSPPLAAAPLDGAEYSIGEAGIAFKPFICSRVEWNGGDEIRWRIYGYEYNAQTYDDAITNVEYPPYSTLRDLYTPPGPVTRIVAYESDGASASGTPIKVVTLAYTQRPEDAQITASFRVFRRRTSDTAWVQVPQVVYGPRSATLDISDVNVGYAFKVIAVSAWGSALSPNDPAVPEAVLTFGLSAPPPPPPDNLTLTATSGNTYTLSWDEEPEAVGYQVLFGGDPGTGLPNDGAEDCLVFARTASTEIAGIELPPSRSCTFWVRSVGANGRMSTAASVVTEATPATPSGESIKQSKTFTLASDGTLTNLTWNGTTGRLELTSPASPGVFASGTVDSGALTLTELTFRPTTANDADDPAINALTLQVPSIAADQWGVVNGGLDVGMLFPPYPDAEQAWSFEVRTHDGSTWSSWSVLAPGASIRRTFRNWECKMTLTRGNAPYRPALAGLTVVLTN